MWQRRRAGRAGGLRVTRPIEAEGLVRHFGDVVAVDGVDLVVEEGEIFGFLGPNGAGKSTIVRMLTTLLKPTAGRARVAGYDVVAEAGAVRRAIGVALQDAAIDPLMTGRELVRLQAVLHGISQVGGRRARRRAARARRPHGRRQPAGRHLLRWHAAAARPRPLARARAVGAVPRRADHRPRPHQPHGALGGGAPAQRRGHHRVPHHAVPRGGRRARRRGSRSSTTAASCGRATRRCSRRRSAPTRSS